MNPLLIAQAGIARMVRQAGNALVDVTVAAVQPITQIAGEDYVPTHKLFTGKGFWEKSEQADYPDSVIMVDDRTLILLQCAHEAKMHEPLRVGNLTYTVEGVMSERVGDVCVMQKLLVRPKAVNVEWESAVLVV